MQRAIPETLARILASSPALNRSYLVGGCVRDWLLQIPHKDYDIEVFGVGYDTLLEALSAVGKPDLVGRSFGVIKLATPEGENYDFSIPRRDSKIGAGHKGFEITFDPQITPREAASRRDFTINSLMYDPRTRETLDFYGGLEDLEQRILRHTSSAFAEDPLRVLRGMQFAGRFGLKPHAETIAFCKSIKEQYSQLAVERVREEWFKWAEKSQKPSFGLHFLEATEWIDHFPEIKALRGTPQDPEWHPEGDVFTHTCFCCDALAGLPRWINADAESKIVYMLATLAHDFAKPQTTHEAIRAGVRRIVSPGHEERGGPIAAAFLDRINAPRAVSVRVQKLVMNHLAHLQAQTDRSVRRLAKRLEPENIRGLATVMIADHMGRPPKPAEIPEGVLALEAIASALQVQSMAPKPILLGRHLIEQGMQPSPEFKRILDAAYEAQLEGKIHTLDDAIQWRRQWNDGKNLE